MKDVNKKKDILYLWIGNHNIDKMAILPKITYRFNSILSKISGAFLLCAEIDKLIIHIQIHMESKESQTAPPHPKTLKVGRLILSDFKTYYKVTVIKTTWCWHKNTHTYQ